MKIVQIKKDQWAAGLKKLASNYRLFGPVREGQYHNFKELPKDQLPDFDLLNTELSPKSVIYPQSQTMFSYSLDEKDPDHHILEEVEKDYSPRAILGIRPCDAKAYVLVQKNFDTPEYKDPFHPDCS
jgi:hypothetical protein